MFTFNRFADELAYELPNGCDGAPAPTFESPNRSDILNAHFGFASGRMLKLGQRLWMEGDERTHVYLIRSGGIVFSQILADGRRVVNGFAFAGDIIGLGTGRHVRDAQAIQQSRLQPVSMPCLKQAVKTDPRFAELMQLEAQRMLVTAYERVAVLSRLAAGERLAHFLIEMSERNRHLAADPSTVAIPMRRADIADYLGLTVETVSRTLTAFRNVGLIVMERPDEVRLTNLPRISALAGGDSDPDDPMRRGS
jgi:CRP/FNR family transcriptional regulator, anaerobic regulatory protein